MSTQGYKQTLIGPKEKDHQFSYFHTQTDVLGNHDKKTNTKH